MASRTAAARTRAKVAETRERSDANPRPTRKHGDPQQTARHPKGGRRGLAVRRVEPTRPDRSKFPAGVEGTKKFRAAEEAYEAALKAYRAGEVIEADGNVAPELEADRRKRRAIEHADHEATKEATAPKDRRRSTSRPVVSTTEKGATANR